MIRRQPVDFLTETHLCEHLKRLSEERSTRGAAGTGPTMTSKSRFELAYQLHGTLRLESKR